MIKKILKVYNELNKDIINEMPVNNSSTRERIAVHLETELQNCNITCDETNNTPDIIDACVCIARVSWINKAMNYSYVDLIFGSKEQLQITYDKLNLIER